MQHRWIGFMALWMACSVPQPELPEPAPEPEAPTYRDPADLPGPHPQPVADAPPEPEQWQPMDPSTLEPMAATPCNPGLAPIYQASPTRDIGLAAQVHGAALGCLENGMLDEAKALADALSREDAEPADAYIQAKVALTRRGPGGEQVCTNDAFMSGILDWVEAAASPEFSARMMVDPSFDAVRSAHRYRVATLPGEDRMAERLVGTLWHGPGVGAYGTVARMQFAEAGQGVMHRADLGEDGMPVWSQTPMTWTVEGQQVTVTEENAATTYIVHESNQTMSVEPGVGIPDFFDYPSECEA